MTDDRWRSPLGTRYASPAMQRLWGEPHRIGLWRRVWLALAESERELGLDIPDEALTEMRAHLDDVDLATAAEYERRFRHDVMAHVHPFGDQAPAARPIIHLGATSAYVTDNADLLVMRDGLRLLLGRLLGGARRARRLRRAARRRALPGLHPLPAGPADHRGQARHALDAGLRHRRRGALPPDRDHAAPRLQGHHRHAGVVPRTLPRRPRQGARARPPGRRAARLPAHLAGDRADLHPEDRQRGARRAERRGAVGRQDGQRPPPPAARGRAARAVRGGADRLQRHGLQAEPDARERISGLARFVMSLQANTAQTAASQWLERTLDDSANRRLSLPEAFLATDAILILAANIAGGLEVRPEVIRAARGGADAVHGHRALAHARRLGRRRPPGAARGGAPPQPGRGRGGGAGRAQRPDGHV